MLENNIKIDLKETGCEHVKWVHRTQDTVLLWAHVNTVMNSIKGALFLD
jgi:hypothetical protein